MATPSGDTRSPPSRTVSAPARPPRPRRTTSLAPAVLVRVRGVMDRRASRSRTIDTQSTSLAPSVSRTDIKTFPDLVLKILRKEPIGTESSNDGRSNKIPHVQIEGGKIWEEFNNHAIVLEKDLQKFQDAVKELGSSLQLTGAARNMRKSISLVTRLFQDNARKLFPRVIGPSIALSNTGPSQRPPRSWPPLGSLSMNANYHFETTTRPIHVELSAMADSVGYLRHALEEFLEFGETEDLPFLPLLRFENDLKYWSACLKHYEGEFELKEVQIYIHDLSRELGAQFEDTSHCLREFIDGVPTVRLAQKHAMSNLQNLATIATFFSAVTATTLQYSFNNNANAVSKAVNVFWFNSLVFSIASALNSFLVLTWRRANYSSPRLRIPWWLWLWIRQCAPVFLLISVVTFLVGLGCFTYSSSQAHFTSIIVIVSETISAFGLAALLVWLTYDKWTFIRERKGPLRVSRFAKSLQGKNNLVLPTHNGHGRTASGNTLLDGLLHDHASKKADSGFAIPQVQTENSRPITLAERKELARAHWRWVLKEVVFFLRVRRKESEREFVESLRMNNQDSRLQKLTVCHELKRQDAGTDTNDIQFDPHGKALAICRTEHSMHFELATAMEITHDLRHLGPARQIIWTSSADHLITRKKNAIHVWHLSGGQTPTRYIRDHSEYIMRMPNTEADCLPKLISIEGEWNKLVVIDISGKEHMVHEFQDIRIQHIDVAPDGKRVLIAAIIPRIEGDHTIKTCLARKLMVLNLETCQIEHEVPIWHNVQHVTLSVNGKWAVITYKDYPPPQLWLLQHTPSGVRLSLDRQFCARERTSTHDFDPSQKVRFSGQGHFVGNDRYILCAASDGKIHVWRRDRSHPVHIHGGLTLDKDKPIQIACNGASKDFMFATRSYDGTIRIWKVHDPPTIRLDTENVAGVTAPTLGSHTSPTRLTTTLDTLSESPQASPQAEHPQENISSEESANNIAIGNPQQIPSFTPQGLAEINSMNTQSASRVRAVEDPQVTSPKKEPADPGGNVGG